MRRPNGKLRFRHGLLQLVTRPAGIVLGKTLKLGEVGGKPLKDNKAVSGTACEGEIENQGLTFLCGVPGAEPGSAGAFAPRFARA